jgi:hypothetical protein
MRRVGGCDRLDAVLLHGAAERELVKGFRGMAKVPMSRILASFSGRAVQRCPVARVDGPWVHGREHDEDYPAIRFKSVALVGCGALGLERGCDVHHHVRAKAAHRFSGELLRRWQSGRRRGRRGLHFRCVVGSQMVRT